MHMQHLLMQHPYKFDRIYNAKIWHLTHIIINLVILRTYYQKICMYFTMEDFNVFEFMITFNFTQLGAFSHSLDINFYMLVVHKEFLLCVSRKRKQCRSHTHSLGE